MFSPLNGLQPSDGAAWLTESQLAVLMMLALGFAAFALFLLAVTAAEIFFAMRMDDSSPTVLRLGGSVSQPARNNSGNPKFGWILAAAARGAHYGRSA